MTRTSFTSIADNSSQHTYQVCELRMIRKDASPFWARLEARTPQDDESGTSVYRVVISKDVTTRKQAEEALRQSHEDFGPFTRG